MVGIILHLSSFFPSLVILSSLPFFILDISEFLFVDYHRGHSAIVSIIAFARDAYNRSYFVEMFVEPCAQGRALLRSSQYERASSLSGIARLQRDTTGPR